ncbi:MAG: galactosyltransferase-related protein [Gemmatimonas sp.]
MTGSAPRVDAAAYDKRLAIIVPYRDRQEHVQMFLPHIVAYFARDKLDRYIDYAIHIVEQAPGKPFNRGLLLNAGFQIARDSCDYVCFHDVDYLPLWADYSYPASPTRLIWHGLTMKEDYGGFFGGVVLFPNEHFAKVNGYSNGYWGWGAEDTELGLRCDISGLPRANRDGTYRALPHPNAGNNPDRTLTPEAVANRQRFRERRDRLAELMTGDGLSSAEFRIAETTEVSTAGLPEPPRGPIRRYLVEV